MTTIRSRIPVLLTDLMFRGVNITFDSEFFLIKWDCKSKETKGHFHIDDAGFFGADTYGENSILIENCLLEIIEHLEKLLTKAPPERNE